MLETTVEWRPEVTNTASISITPTFSRTDRCSWFKSLNPNLGVEELAWIGDNQDRLVRYVGCWVAISESQVIASGDSANEVYEYLKAGKIRGALVTFVHGIPNKWDNLIA